MNHRTLTPDELYHQCDLSQISFKTTQDLSPVEDLALGVTQPRAAEALKFGVGIQHSGYNIYALGPPGTGKHTMIQQFLDKHLVNNPTPSDWCYVNNFEDSTKPKAMSLSPGQGYTFAQEVENLIEEARNSLKAAFESEEYQNRLRALEQEYKEQQQNVFEDLQKKAQEKNLSLVRTPNGIAFGPLKENGELMPPEEFQKLPEEQRKEIEEDIKELQDESQRIFQKFPAWQRELREKTRELNQEIASYTIKPLIDELRSKYQNQEAINHYLDSLEKDIINNAFTLLNPEGQSDETGQQQTGSSYSMKRGSGTDAPALRKYKINVLVDNSATRGSPVIYEDNPTYANLIGRVEYIPQMGALTTDFNLIKPGALHRANGGALILDAHKVLTQPGAWDGLKRALNSGKIKIESLAEMFSLISTISLEPEPVPLNVKVVMVGNPLIYYLLKQLDPEFDKLFKVAADFDTQMDWDSEHTEFYARLISNIVSNEQLKHFDKDAVARLIEHSARQVGDQEKLSTHMSSLSDLIREADYRAEEQKRQTVSAEDVQNAIDAFIFRSDLIRERIHEQIERGIVLIDTEDSQIGQVNGLSVIQLGEFMFGRPNRITAKTRLGKGEVLDIEREVKLSGPIHSKGVLILAGFLGSRYSPDSPLSLSASLVFEQSYSGIEGDSASSAELYALLSSIAEIPIKQSLAVTGSVNQNGQIQAIGGVNEKIEGFFDICKAKGLNGEQGVLIPQSNIKHLMLRKDVIQAVKDGQFHIYPVQHIDQGLEILTGKPAGKPDQKNIFPDDTVNGLVQKRLKEMADKRQSFSAIAEQGGQSDTGK